MFELDADVFQTLTLALLVAAVVLLSLILAAVRRRSPSPTAVGEAQPAPAEQLRAAGSTISEVELQAAAVESHPLDEVRAETVGSEPENEPFEKDGRWWFKRGHELLVYDEQTAQWEPAPAAGASAETSAVTTTTPAASQPVATQAAAQPVAATTETSPAPADAQFWKCPSCGAINGSTAESCRMCFTART